MHCDIQEEAFSCLFMQFDEIVVVSSDNLQGGLLTPWSTENPLCLFPSFGTWTVTNNYLKLLVIVISRKPVWHYPETGHFSAACQRKKDTETLTLPTQDLLSLTLFIGKGSSIVPCYEFNSLSGRWWRMFDSRKF